MLAWGEWWDSMVGFGWLNGDVLQTVEASGPSLSLESSCLRDDPAPLLPTIMGSRRCSIPTVATGGGSNPQVAFVDR